MYVLIGGGELGDGGTMPIDAAIVKTANKTGAAFLFIPTASRDAEDYIRQAAAVYGDALGCRCDCLRLSVETDSRLIEEKIEKADIIYVGGGDTKYLIRTWKECGLPRLLRRQADSKILCGLSAGSICWFEKGISDANKLEAEDWEYCLAEGLGFLPGIHMPHLNERESEKRYLDFIARNDLSFIGIDNDCALVIDGGVYRLIRARADSAAYRIRTMAGQVEKRPIADLGKTEELFAPWE